MVTPTLCKLAGFSGGGWIAGGLLENEQFLGIVTYPARCSVRWKCFIQLRRRIIYEIGLCVCPCECLIKPPTSPFRLDKTRHVCIPFFDSSTHTRSDKSVNNPRHKQRHLPGPVSGLFGKKLSLLFFGLDNGAVDQDGGPPNIPFISLRIKCVVYGGLFALACVCLCLCACLCGLPCVW